MLFVSPLFAIYANVLVNISIDQSQHHYAQMMLEFDKFDRNQNHFHLPTWRTE